MPSNVFVLPSSTETIYRGRSVLNDSLQALLQNFYSVVPPQANSVSIEGTIGLQPGMLWVSQGNANVSSRVFMYDPSMPSHPLYSGFTRDGIGILSQNTLAQANTALASGALQSGELVRIRNLDRVFLVSHDRTNLIDLGTSSTVEVANNALNFNGLPSSSFVQVNSNVTLNAQLGVSSSGSISVGPLTISNTVSNATFSTSTGSLVFNSSNVPVQVSGVLRANSYTQPTTQSSGASVTFDCSRTNVFLLNLTANTTVSFSNVPVSGNSYTCMVVANSSPTSMFTISWPGSVRWAGGIVPATMDLSQIDIYTFNTVSGGSVWYGIIAGQDFS